MEIGFVTKADARYFIGLKNLIASLKRSNPNIPITVFDCGLTYDQKSEISKYVHKILDLSIDYYQIKEIDTDRFTNSIYAAMYLDKVEYDVVFHVDADVVVLEDLEHVFRKCKTEHFMGASDYPPLSLANQILDDEIIETLTIINPNINWNAKTFNGGVFCITRSFFEIYMLPKIREYSRFHHKFKTNDQALLNLAYASLERSHFFDMGIHYNFRPHFSRAPETKLSETFLNEKKILTGKFSGETIKIFHYIREPKPWMDGFDKTSLPYKIWHQFSEG